MKEIIICGSILSFVLCFVIGHILHRKQKTFNKDTNKEFIININVATAGVLLGISLHHILCESIEHLQDITKGTIGNGRLLRFCTMAYFFGFLFMFFLEKICINHVHNSKLENMIYSEFTVEFNQQKNNIEYYKMKKRQSQITSYIFIYTIMCFHSVLAGIGSSFNIQSTTILIFILISFMIHKMMDTMIISKGMLEINLNKKIYYVLLCIFSLMTPSGFLTGSYIDINHMDKFYALVLFFFQLFTGGIFLYIATIEIMIEYVLDMEKKTRKCIIFMVFYFLVSIIGYLD